MFQVFFDFFSKRWEIGRLERFEDWRFENFEGGSVFYFVVIVENLSVMCQFDNGIFRRRLLFKCGWQKALLFVIFISIHSFIRSPTLSSFIAFKFFSSYLLPLLIASEFRCSTFFLINAVFELIYSLCIVYTIYKFCCCFFFFFVFYIFFLLSSRLHFHLNFHFKSKISCCCHLILVIYIMNISHLFVRTVTFLSLSALPEHSLHLRVILNDNKILKLTFGFFFLSAFEQPWTEHVRVHNRNITHRSPNRKKKTMNKLHERIEEAEMKIFFEEKKKTMKRATREKKSLFFRLNFMRIMWWTTKNKEQQLLNAHLSCYLKFVTRSNSAKKK